MTIKFIFQLLSTITLSVMLGACTTPNGQSLYQRLSKPALINTTPPDGPYNYQQGWKDGCESGIASTNHFTQQSLGAHRFVLHEQLRNDQLYNKAWRYAYNHCGYSMRSVARYDF